MNLDPVTTRWLAGYVGLGALLGVLILHPAARAIYWWFETPDETLRHFVAQRLVHTARLRAFLVQRLGGMHGQETH